MGNKLVGVLGPYHAGHPLLAFGDSQFGAVQALVFFGNGVQVDHQAVRQFADGHRNTAGAEVVAAADQAGDLRLAEQTLQFPFFRRVALLHFAAAGFNGLDGVALGGAGGAAATVPSGASAQQDDDVAGFRHFPDHVFCRGSAHHSADLHSLGHIAGVVNFTDLAGSQADLVAVGGVAVGSAVDQLLLGQLALDGFAYRGQGVACTGNPHGLVDIAPAGQGVPDRTAQAGGCAAEGLDFSGVVVGFVFEHQQPVFLAAVVHGDFNLHRTGVDFFAFIQIGELAFRLELAGADSSQIH